MSHDHAPAGDEHGYEDHGEGHYIKVWAILVVLLAVSVAGPMVGIWWLTMVTAFGIACVKAFLVCKNFMHLNVQKPFVVYLLITALVFMFLFFFAVAPDVMKHSGTNWVNDAAKHETARAEAAHAAGLSERQDGKGGHEGAAPSEGAAHH